MGCQLLLFVDSKMLNTCGIVPYYWSGRVAPINTCGIVPYYWSDRVVPINVCDPAASEDDLFEMTLFWRKVRVTGTVGITWDHN